MKLKNKKTGEIVEPFGITCVNDRTFVQFDDGKGTFKFEAHSLAELNEEWEDYEEPKDYWFIRDDGSAVGYSSIGNNTVAKRREAIGNYFETKEEAEKAVEKLKAVKRLKDKGFRFVEYRNTLANVGCPYRFIIEASVDACEKADLDLLFGGE